MVFFCFGLLVCFLPVQFYHGLLRNPSLYKSEMILFVISPTDKVTWCGVRLSPLILYSLYSERKRWVKPWYHFIFIFNSVLNNQRERLAIARFSMNQCNSILNRRNRFIPAGISAQFQLFPIISDTLSSLLKFRAALLKKKYVKVCRVIFKLKMY